MVEIHSFIHSFYLMFHRSTKNNCKFRI